MGLLNGMQSADSADRVAVIDVQFGMAAGP